MKLTPTPITPTSTLPTPITATQPVRTAPRWAAVALAAAAACCWPSARPAAAQVSGRAGVLRETDKVLVDDKGDATFTGRVTFPTEASYAAVKGNFPNPYVLLRSLLGSGGKGADANAKVDYDDAKRCVNFSADVLGSAVDKHNKWRMFVGQGAELLHQDGHTATLMNVADLNGAIGVVSSEVNLPAGADHVKVDSDAGILSFDLTRQPVAGAASLDVDLKVKPRLMSALYKVYANDDFADGAYWTAKTLFTNSGTGDITHLRVSYHMGDYTEDWSTPTEYSLVAPGGHVVDLYYPLLKASAATLKSQAPVDLEVKYSYVDAAGKTVEDTTSKRITLLGANQFEFSNVPEEERTQTWTDHHGNDPLLAAFATKMDEPVRALGGLAAQACHGQPAGENDNAAILFCQALYNLEMSNGMAYQWAVGDDLGHGNSSQALKYPRDCIRDKSGTCVELALLYASVCETEGLSCTLVSIPGHCFPLVHLPSGDTLPVEATCISIAAIPDDKRTDPYSFVDAVKLGRMEMAEINKKPYTLVNIDDVQGKGVVCPELPALPSNALATWGWKAADAQPDVQPDRQARQDEPAPDQPRPQQADPVHPPILAGIWDLRVQNARGWMTMTLQLTPDGHYSAAIQSSTGQQSNDHGTWSIIDHQYVARSDVTGARDVDDIRLNGDTLTVHNDQKNFTANFTRRQQ